MGVVTRPRHRGQGGPGGGRLSREFGKVSRQSCISFGTVARMMGVPRGNRAQCSHCGVQDHIWCCGATPTHVWAWRA
jgi:hypothetical protein